MSALQERLGNLGYGALVKEVTPGVPLTPTAYFLLYKANINTDLHLDEDNPVAGVRSMPFAQYMGMRSHEGQLTVLAEPNTLEYFLDMFLAAGSITGSGPYTHPFTEGLSNSYTMDLLKGQVVERYWGVQVEDIESNWNKNKMELNLSISARGSFISRKILSISTTTVVLDTAYDPAPNKGLVVGDLIRVMKADGTTVLDTVIASSGVNADGVTITLGASAAAYAAGDFVFIRAGTPSLATKTPFLWARTEFRYGTSASAALTATQLQLETGSKWKVSHKFEKKQGSDRSGSFDPASLVRLQTEADLTLKTFFDQPQKLQKYLDVASTEALVIRHFSETGYELRLTFNQLNYKLNKRDFESAKILYQEMTGRPTYSQADGQLMDIKLINNLAA